jgi:GT2 family glycosyltransferase
MSRNRKSKRTLVDVALLTCGLVDQPVFDKCVDAIKREMQSTDCEFHVILNGVAKESRDFFTSKVNSIPDAKIRHSSEMLGFSAAANRVIKQGTSPLVLFITDDIILHEGTLEKLVRRMDDPDIGLCGLKLIFPSDSTDPNRPAGRVQHIGHAIDVRGEITHPLIGWLPDNPKCNVSREVQSVTGGVFMVRRNSFLRAGGFFDGYGRGYYEDTDLCFSIRRNAEKKIFIDTEATADHVTNASFMKAIKAGTFIPMEQNKMIFRSRWGRFMQNDSFSFW